MKKYGIWMILCALFFIEGTIMKWVIPAEWQTSLYIIPHFALVIILYISIFFSRYYGLIAGLIFGFLQDVIYYGHALGVYSFAMGLTCYAAGLLLRRPPQQLLVAITIVLAGNMVYDYLLYGVYRFFLRVTSVSAEWVLTHQILPSLFINLLFALALYVPVRHLLESMSLYLAKDDD
jgi:rod shape-determining protein MreD